MIKTQKTEESTGHSDQSRMSASPMNEQTPAVDTSFVESDVILASSGTTTFKLLQRVRSNTCSRLIDPIRAMLKIAHCPLICSACTHFNRDGLRVQSRVDLDVTMWSFDDLLVKWSADVVVKQPSNTNTGSKYSQLTLTHVMVSNTLDFFTKVNVVLSLSADDNIAINHANACIDCCIKTLFQSNVKDRPGFKNRFERGG
jgi:hypothetical protein